MEAAGHLLLVGLLLILDGLLGGGQARRDNVGLGSRDGWLVEGDALPLDVRRLLVVERGLLDRLPDRKPTLLPDRDPGILGQEQHGPVGDVGAQLFSHAGDLRVVGGLREHQRLGAGIPQERIEIGRLGWIGRNGLHGGGPTVGQLLARLLGYLLAGI